MRTASGVLAVSILASAVLAGCSPKAGESAENAPVQAAPGQTAAGGAASQPCTPLETRERRTARDQRAGLAGADARVRRDAPTWRSTFRWSRAGWPSRGRWSRCRTAALLVSEKARQPAHRLRRRGRSAQPIAGVPAVDARGQGGLLDVALSPGFATDRTIFWSFTEPRDGGNGTSVARGVLSADGRRLEQVRVILHTRPTYNNNMHYGSRLAFGPDGMLYVTMGERSDARDAAAGAGAGTATWARRCASTPPTAPRRATTRAWARPARCRRSGRSATATSRRPRSTRRGSFWTIEHGTRGGDELNRVEPGKNYGWPIAAYGVEYRGRAAITSALGAAHDAAARTPSSRSTTGTR